MLGVLLGLAALSKLQGLGLIGLAGGAVLFMAWQRRTWRMLWVAAVAVGAPALALAGWWYVRNLALYGDWSGLQHLTAINGRRQEPLTLAIFWPEFRGLRYSFWGLFGWFNLLLPNWFYWLTDALTVLAGVGVVAALVRRWRSLAAPRLADAPLRGVVIRAGGSLFTSSDEARVASLAPGATAVVTLHGVRGEVGAGDASLVAYGNAERGGTASLWTRLDPRTGGLTVLPPPVDLMLGMY